MSSCVGHTRHLVQAADDQQLLLLVQLHRHVLPLALQRHIHISAQGENWISRRFGVKGM